MSTEALRIKIDLSGIASRVQRVLKQVTYMASIGVRATDAINAESLRMPELNFEFLYDQSNPWTPEQAKNVWRQWVLTNAFRDIAEIVSRILEEAQHVLALWSVLDPKVKGTVIKVERWNKEVINRREQFHRRTLPQKIEFLKEKYGFSLADDEVREALSINAARNCFVHRGGQITKLDVDSSGTLTLRWRQMILYVDEGGKQQELVLPYFAEKDTEITIKVESKSREFSVGQTLEVTLTEFSGICWTLFSIAQHMGKSLEAYGRAKGFDIAPTQESRAR